MGEHLVQMRAAAGCLSMTTSALRRSLPRAICSPSIKALGTAQLQHDLYIFSCQLILQKYVKS